MKRLLLLLLVTILTVSSNVEAFLGQPAAERIVRDPLALSSALISRLEENPFTHHSKEYTFPDHKIAGPYFASFRKYLNPIFHDLIKQRLSENPDAPIPKFDISHHMLPMRDGIKLSTIVIVPKGAEEGAAQGRPTILGRSPYGPTSDLVALVFTILNGHAAVIQDQRGSFLSEGEFSMWQKDGDDGEDTMQWVSDQPWSNGDVFQVGISADGCGALAVVLNKPKHLKGQLIMWSSADGHKTSYPGGAFREGLLTGWMSIMGLLTRGHSLTHTLPDVLRNEVLGPWWEKIQMSQHAPNVVWPMIHLSAWWDIFQGHQLDAYDEFRKNSQPSVRDAHTLIVSPLGHCMLGNLNPNLALQDARAIINGYGYASEVFDSMSKGEGPYGKGHFANKLKRINIYVQGSIHHSGEVDKGSSLGKAKKYGNYWTSFDNWPKPELTKLYITPGGVLADEPIPAGQLGSEGMEEFNYNPANPYITHGGNNLILIFLGMGCGSMDQRHVEARPDVLTFTTEVLTEPVAILGQVTATLHVSSNRNDTDFFVSLTDVHPDGSSMQVRFGIQRMRWRESTTFVQKRSPPMEDGKVYRVEIDMWRTAHVFSPGHKIRIAISSSNTPYYSRNDDSGSTEKPYDIDAKTDVPAKNRVHWTPDAPSYIQLPLVHFDQIPENKAF